MSSGLAATFIVVGTVAGLVVGALLAHALSKGQLRLAEERAGSAALQAEKAASERLAEKDAEIARMRAMHAETTAEIARLGQEFARADQTAKSAEREKLAALEEKEQSMRALLREKQDAIDQQKRLMEQRLSEAFAALSSKTLQEVSTQFLKLANENFGTQQAAAKGELEQRKVAIEDMIKPIREGLEKLDKQCSELETKREVAYTTIEGHVGTLMSAAGQLSNALRRPTVRGSWGEMTLRTVVENAGLQEGVHFVTQHSTEADDGRLRADMVVNLPKSRKIALDSKAPLDSFREAVNCEDEALRDQLYKRHSASVRNHMKSLSEKRYWNQYEGLDIVMMFLPSEAMFYTAVEHDSTLLEDARKSRVYLANPSTLMATLNAIAYVLDQERLNDSALEISKIGRNLHDGVRTFAGHMERLGTNLRRSVESFNGSVRSLERSVLPRTRQLRVLGVGGDEIEELDEIEVLPIGFQKQDLIGANGADVLALTSAEPTQPLVRDLVTGGAQT